MHTSTGSGSAFPARAGKPKAGLRRRRARQWPGRLLRVMGSAAAFASAAAAMAAFASGPSGASSPSGAVLLAARLRRRSVHLRRRRLLRIWRLSHEMDAPDSRPVGVHTFSWH